MRVAVFDKLTPPQTPPHHEAADSPGLPILEPSEEGGYTALVPSLPGCISEGDTAEEAMDNIREAIELYLEPIDDIEASAEGVLVKDLIL